MPAEAIGDRFGSTTVTFTPEQSHQIERVLRLRAGDRVVAVCAGREHMVELTAIAHGRSEGRVIEVRRPDREPPLRVVLAQGLPKGDKMEMIVQKAVEIGVAEIRPLRAARCVVQLQGERARARTQRWQAIAREASEQSGRLAVPPVHEVCALADALAEARESGDSPALLLLWEGETSTGLAAALRSRTAATGPVWLFVGPEGGWAPEEVDLARAAGAVPVSLGPRILRTETAGPAALAMVLFALGDLGRAPGGER